MVNLPLFYRTLAGVVAAAVVAHCLPAVYPARGSQVLLIVKVDPYSTHNVVGSSSGQYPGAEENQGCGTVTGH